MAQLRVQLVERLVARGACLIPHELLVMVWHMEHVVMAIAASLTYVVLLLITIEVILSIIGLNVSGMLMVLFHHALALTLLLGIVTFVQHYIILVHLHHS
jgi:hypothetical protein